MVIHEQPTIFMPRKGEYASNFWLWRNTGYFDPTSETFPLLHTWSLAVEEQFYFVAPVSLVLFHRFWKRAVIPAAVVLAGATLCASQLWVHSRQPAVFFLAPFRAWEFLVGGGIALVRPRAPGAFASRFLGLLASGLVVGPLMWLGPESTFPGLGALAPVLGTGILLWLGPHVYGLGRVLESSPVVLVGRASYSLYLWHWPVLVLWRAWNQGAEEEGVLSLAGQLGLTVVLAGLSFTLVETPLRAPVARFRARIAVGSLAVSSVLCGLGLWAIRSDGWPTRFDDRVVALDRAREPTIPFIECFGPDRPSGGDCLLGDKTVAPDVLLWGDSHALALAPGLDSALSKSGRSALLIASSVCPPVLGIHSRESRGGDWRCESTEARVREALRAQSGLRQVVLVAVWTAYLEDAGSVQLSDSMGERPNGAVLVAGLSSTLEYLAARDLDVAIVSQVPRYGANVPYEMARALASGKAPILRLTLAEVRRTQARFDETLQRLRLKHPFRILDLPFLFCGGPTGLCEYERAGVPLYRDDNHLSALGADQIHWAAPSRN